jgi:membrane protease YdiL (CAAX protease family)
VGIKSSIICLHLLSIINFLPILALKYLGYSKLLLLIGGIYSLILFIAVQVIIRGLKKEKYWSWVAGIIILALHLNSLYIIICVIGLIGMFNKETRALYSH